MNTTVQSPDDLDRVNARLLCESVAIMAEPIDGLSVPLLRNPFSDMAFDDRLFIHFEFDSTDYGKSLWKLHTALLLLTHSVGALAKETQRTA